MHVLYAIGLQNSTTRPHVTGNIDTSAASQFLRRKVENAESIESVRGIGGVVRRGVTYTCAGMRESRNSDKNSEEDRN